MSKVRWDYGEAYVYDGNEKTVRLTGLPEGVTPVYGGEYFATVPGTYVAGVTFLYDKVNYNEPLFYDFTWEITESEKYGLPTWMTLLIIISGSSTVAACFVTGYRRAVQKKSLLFNAKRHK
jgi:hypothetical protein